MHAGEREAELQPVEQREVRARARERAHQVRRVADDGDPRSGRPAMSLREGIERAGVDRGLVAVLDEVEQPLAPPGEVLPQERLRLDGVGGDNP